MDKIFENKLKEYFGKSKSRCFAFKNWLALNDKKFSLVDAMKCIYDYSNGNFSVMDDIIDHITDKKKVYGRTQVYGSSDFNRPNIVRNGNGVLELINYREDAPLTAKGQKLDRNSKIFRKSDNQPNKLYNKTEDKLYDMGYRLRNLFPDETNSFLTFALQGVRKYSIQHKINPNKVIDALEKKRVKFDDNFNIVRNVTEGRIIVISESMANELSNDLKMTEYKFFSNVKQFLCDLLTDPVNCKVPFILKQHGLNRYKLLSYLLSNGIIEKEETICDKDENGQPKTATMKVKYCVPKKNFERKLKKLYIRLFEKNLPLRTEGIVDTKIGLDGDINADDLAIMRNSPLTMGVVGNPDYKQIDNFAIRFNKELKEDGEGSGATSAESSGQFTSPMAFVQRRKIGSGLDETTSTTNIGDYEYTVPFVGDKETLSRKNGEGGSVSINKL